MATIYRFSCSGCGYEVDAAGASAAYELAGYIHTVCCRTCSPPVLVNARKRTEPFEQSDRASDYVCPHELKGGIEHDISCWRRGDACPRCNELMVRDPLYRMMAD